MIYIVGSPGQWLIDEATRLGAVRLVGDPKPPCVVVADPLSALYVRRRGVVVVSDGPAPGVIVAYRHGVRALLQRCVNVVRVLSPTLEDTLARLGFSRAVLRALGPLEYVVDGLSVGAGELYTICSIGDSVDCTVAKGTSRGSLVAYWPVEPRGPFMAARGDLVYEVHIAATALSPPRPSPPDEMHERQCRSGSV